MSQLRMIKTMEFFFYSKPTPIKKGHAMKITAAFALAASILFLTGCDKLSESKDKGLTEIKNIEQRWSDGIQLAHSTARIALSNQVANLQSIKRDLDNVAVSECMQDAKTLLASHMELSIQGFLGFMQEDEYNAERNFKARGHGDAHINREMKWA